MRFVIATTLAVSLGAGSALAQSSEISLGWYEDNWEATTFPSGDGGWNCSVDSRADNFPSSDGAWVFVFPEYLQFSPNSGLPIDGTGTVTVDNYSPIELQVYDGQVGFVSEADGLQLLRELAFGEVMTIAVWPQSRPNAVVEYVYSLNGFREGYLRIAAECRFDPSPVVDVPPALPGGQAQPESSGGSSLFGRNKN